ncbi:hypothetical protein K438DRAFT_1865746 [Mycena galopus ATCC 62051]|nr:hypothetical protein K438DRAFT_1865746 [Mycena galopus ATCC 62051]
MENACLSFLMPTLLTGARSAVVHELTHSWFGNGSRPSRLDVFLPYVKDYVQTFIGTNTTTAQRKAHLYEFYSKHGGPEKIKLLDGVDWDGLELPAAYAHADRGATTFTKTDLDGFNANQTSARIPRTPQSLPPLPSRTSPLYVLSSTPNAEIRLRFYALALSPPTSDAAAHFAGERDGESSARTEQVWAG